jgi:inorganic pyrophosphatase
MYDDIKTHEDMPPLLLKQIAHFFEHYKDLEKGKWVKLKGWKGIDAAKKEILDSVERFDSKKNKPHF